MADMIVNLYQLPEEPSFDEVFKEHGIRIKRPLSAGFVPVMEFVEEHFGKGWMGECQMAFSHLPVRCFIAEKDKEIVGFACYNSTANGFFGPTGVKQECRGQGIGKALLFKSLLAMKEEDYAYAIIGDAAVTAEKFYESCVGAVKIQQSGSIYDRL